MLRSMAILHKIDGMELTAQRKHTHSQKYTCVCVVDKRKQRAILNGPTKSKLILLMIGTCCLTSTFTL